MLDRRELLARSAALTGLMATAGLLPQSAMAAWNQAAFEARSVSVGMQALGAAEPVESHDVTITCPDIAENGAVVPVGASTTLPGVKRLLIMIEKNPALLAAAFDVTESIEPAFTTRVKMNQSSNVIAVAMMADGKVLFAQKEVKVTLGGCGG